MTKQDDIDVIRYYISHAQRGVKYMYLPDLLLNCNESHDDYNLYQALDQLHRLGNMNSRVTKEQIIDKILTWYESKSEGL